MNHQRMHILAALLLAGLPLGCGESDGGDPNPGEAGSSDGALYAMSLQVPSLVDNDYGSIPYLVTSTSLDEGTVLSPDDGIEGAGRQTYGVDGYPAVWLEAAAEEEPVLERWDLQGDELVAPGFEQTISFASLTPSLSYAFGTFVSPELGIVTLNAKEIATWNPSAMELLDWFPIRESATEIDNVTRYRARPDGTIVASGTRYVYDAETDEWGNALGYFAVVLDADGSEVVADDLWEGLEGYAAEGMAADGTTYFVVYTPYDQVDFEDPDSAFAQKRSTCLLRILPDASEFDRDFGCMPIVDLVEDAGDDDFGWTFIVSGNSAFFELSRADGEGGTNSRFYRWDLESERAERIGSDELATPLGTGISWLNVDGRIFFYDSYSGYQINNQCITVDDEAGSIDRDCEAEASERGTPFFEVTESGIEPAFTVAAAVYVNGIVKVR